MKFKVFSVLTIVVFSSLFYLDSFAQKSDDDYLKEISGFWKDAEKSIIEIRLDKEEKFIIMFKSKFIVKLDEIDTINHIIKLKVLKCISNDNRPCMKDTDEMFYYFRQVYSDDGNSFYLVVMVEKNGEQGPFMIDLYFMHN